MCAKIASFFRKGGEGKGVEWSIVSISENCVRNRRGIAHELGSFERVIFRNLRRIGGYYQNFQFFDFSLISELSKFWRIFLLFLNIFKVLKSNTRRNSKFFQIFL